MGSRYSNRKNNGKIMDNSLELYIKYLKNEIFFCKKAIDAIYAVSKDQSVDPKMLFYHASVLFHALANISKTINNNYRKERSDKIKKNLGIDDSLISIINNRGYRNSNEHFDERIDTVLCNQDISPSFIDLSIFEFLIYDIATGLNNFGRMYIVSENAFYFVNPQATTEKILLTDIEKAVEYIDSKLAE